jgi:fermentation-respiration switch protein FrsA (DUF1100 family)
VKAVAYGGVGSVTLRLLAFSVVLVGAILFLFWLTQRRMMYFPSGSVPTPAQVGLGRTEAVSFATDDGLMLGGWFVRTDRPSAGTVLVFNGNAGNRAYRADLAARLAAESLSVLLFDYRGYGGNPGLPTEEGLALDARAARRYVLSRSDVDARRLVYFGESLGTAVAVRLAVEHPPQAVILRSPFTSFVDVGRFHYPILPVRWLLRDRYPSLDRIARIRSPLLVIAGSNDTIIPPFLSRRLFEAALEPKRLVIVEGADHNDETLAAGAEVVGAVAAFLRGLSN